MSRSKAFDDLCAVDWIDDRQEYGEERVILLGMTDGRVLTVVYTERETSIRIISAREANRYGQTLYFGQNAPPQRRLVPRAPGRL